MGAGFTFAITDVTDGSIIGDGEAARTGSFFLRVTGIVTHADGSRCRGGGIWTEISAESRAALVNKRARTVHSHSRCEPVHFRAALSP